MIFLILLLEGMGFEDEMCQLYLMYYSKDGRDAKYMICTDEESDTVSAEIPNSSIVNSLPANPPDTTTDES